LQLLTRLLLKRIIKEGVSMLSIFLAANMFNVHVIIRCQDEGRWEVTENGVHTSPKDFGARSSFESCSSALVDAEFKE